jgi:nitrite reductase/ring-hydroxylating ferredoxin subunit
MTITADLADLENGELRAVSGDVCVARTGNLVVAFGRTCPHAGADLANGYVDGPRVRCAWHNTPFDLADGRSPCTTLPCLKTYPVRSVGGGVYEIDVADAVTR